MAIAVRKFNHHALSQYVWIAIHFDSGVNQYHV